MAKNPFGNITVKNIIHLDSDGGKSAGIATAGDTVYIGSSNEEKTNIVEISADGISFAGDIISESISPAIAALKSLQAIIGTSFCELPLAINDVNDKDGIFNLNGNTIACAQAGFIKVELSGYIQALAPNDTFTIKMLKNGVEFEKAVRINTGNSPEASLVNLNLFCLISVFANDKITVEAKTGNTPVLIDETINLVLEFVR